MAKRLTPPLPPAHPLDTPTRRILTTLGASRVAQIQAEVQASLILEGFDPLTTQRALETALVQWAEDDGSEGF
jgi:hypothetical protein